MATIKLVNEIDFAASSVSKIARGAGVSPATLYIYFKNKEDLLISTYLQIKQGMSRAMLEDFDEDLPIHDIFHKIWCNTFAYVSANLEKFRYTEQFANSPYNDRVDRERIEKSFEPLVPVILLECGAYNEHWSAVHMHPEQTVQAFLDLGGSILQPIHWATFNLALHPWYEPMERLLAEARGAGVQVSTPVMGEVVDYEEQIIVKRWWEPAMKKSQESSEKVRLAVADHP